LEQERLELKARNYGLLFRRKARAVILGILVPDSFWIQLRICSSILSFLVIVNLYMSNGVSLHTCFQYLGYAYYLLRPAWVLLVKVRISWQIFVAGLTVDQERSLLMDVLPLFTWLMDSASHSHGWSLAFEVFDVFVDFSYIDCCRSSLPWVPAFVWQHGFLLLAGSTGSWWNLTSSICHESALHGLTINSWRRFIGFQSMSLSHLFSYDVFLNRIKSLRFIVFQQLGHVCFHFGLSLVFLRCFFKLFKSFFASFLQLFDVFLRRKNRF
jgi:hypothetical protein